MEPTLSLKVSDLQAEVGLFLGWGKGADFGDPAWTSRQEAVIVSVVKSGLRQFYFPEPLDGGASYDWSFLKPVATLALASGATVMPLPDDYGGFEGQITLAADAGQSYWPIELIPIGTIYAQQSRLPSTSGRPLYACEEPLRGAAALQGQRFQLRFWPTADADYSVRFQYYLSPDALTGATPYAYGGSQHAETILESCLAIAEQRVDDAADVHTKKWQMRLAASVSIDRRNKPQKLGYNGDNSDGWWYSNRRLWGLDPVTVNGVEY